MGKTILVKWAKGMEGVTAARERGQGDRGQKNFGTEVGQQVRSRACVAEEGVVRSYCEGAWNKQNHWRPV